MVRAANAVAEDQQDLPGEPVHDVGRVFVPVVQPPGDARVHHADDARQHSVRHLVPGVLVLVGGRGAGHLRQNAVAAEAVPPYRLRLLPGGHEPVQVGVLTGPGHRLGDDPADHEGRRSRTAESRAYPLGEGGRGVPGHLVAEVFLAIEVTVDVRPRDTGPRGEVGCSGRFPEFLDDGGRGGDDRGPAAGAMIGVPGRAARRRGVDPSRSGRCLRLGSRHSRRLSPGTSCTRRETGYIMYPGHRSKESGHGPRGNRYPPAELIGAEFI